MSPIQPWGSSAFSISCPAPKLPAAFPNASKAKTSLCLRCCGQQEKATAEAPPAKALLKCCWCHSLGDGLVAVPDGLQEPLARLLVLGSAAQPVPLLLQRRHLHTQQRHLWAEGGGETQGCSGNCTASVWGEKPHGPTCWLRGPLLVEKAASAAWGLLVLVPPSMKWAGLPWDAGLSKMCHQDDLRNMQKQH